MVNVLESTLFIERPALNKVIEIYFIAFGTDSKLNGVEVNVAMDVTFFVVTGDYLDELDTDHDDGF
jgi:hypothetical protein